MKKQTHRLTYPAPYRQHERTDNGWRSIPWSLGAVLRTILSGGWFRCNDAEYCFEPGVREWTAQAQENLRAI